MRPIETIPRMGEREIKRNDGYIVRTFVNVTIYPQYNKNKNCKNKVYWLYNFICIKIL
jgi:hypothetical protein